VGRGGVTCAEWFRPPWRPSSSPQPRAGREGDTTTAEDRSIKVADVVAQARDGRLEDFVREAVALGAQKLMAAEVTAEVGARRGRAGGAVDAPQRVPPAAVGDEGPGARAVDPAQIARGQRTSQAF
jgi:hypothetical protein